MRSEQKEERRQEILDTAWRLFQTTSYEALTIVEVAQTAKLAKGTIFLYFKTREALFLALVEQQLASWFGEVDTRLAELQQQGQGESRLDETIGSVTDILCQALEARPGLTRLLAILHTLLERNIDLETAYAFKIFLREHFEHTGAALERSLTFLAPGEGAHLLLRCQALVIGTWHLADAAPVARQAIQRPELRHFEVHFGPELTTSLRALLYGLAYQANTTTL